MVRLRPIILSLLAKATATLGGTILNKSWFVLHVQRFLVRLVFRSNTVSFSGQTFRVHASGEFISMKLILSRGYERKEIDYLCSLVKKGDTVADVGANIGLYTIALSKAVGSEGTVLAFEPDPENVKLLRENVELNHCLNVEIFPYALGFSNETARLYLCDENKGYQSMADLANTGVHIDIEVKKAGDILDGYQLDVMKIDVEGAEPLVWAGMNVKPRIVLFEFVPAQIRALSNDPVLFLEQMIQDGYALHRFEDGLLVPTTPKEMTNLADSTGCDYNMFAKRME